MILRPAKPAEPLPWEGLSLGGLAFGSLWTTGPDPTVDGVVRLLALRAAGESFDRRCDPDGQADAASFDAAWPELERFLGAGPVVVPDVA